MGKLRFYRALLAVPGLSYRAKALGLAAIAALIPAVPLIILTFWPEVFFSQSVVYVMVTGAVAASIVMLIALDAFLSAIDVTAAHLRASATRAGVEGPRTGRSDEVYQMMTDVGAVSAKLDSVRHRLAQRHPVTGIATREPLLAAVAKDLAGGAATGLMGVLRFAQLDRIAAVDRRGADVALKQFAQRLRDGLAGAGVLAQVDKDCFAIWFGDAIAPKTAGETLKTLAASLAQPIGEDEKAISPDVRVGIAIYPDDGADGPALLDRAILALAKSERTSTGRISFFSDDSPAAAEARFSIGRALSQAVVRQELALFYQPVIDTTAGRVIGAEALLRWRHPELGLIPPAQFLPVLEQSGLIDEVGRWVFDTACRDARSFESLGLPGFKVGVNLSERQFRFPGLPALVADTLKRHDLKPQRLELELTENALMSDLEHTSRTFDALRALGVSVAIDDFGAGASSLGDLKSLTFSKLKIDRAFVTEVPERHASQAVCAALIELGRRLDIAVLATGVETREEVEALRVLGCNLFQGFFFARPLPADKFVKKVSDPEWVALLASPVHRQILDVETRLAG